MSTSPSPTRTARALPGFSSARAYEDVRRLVAIGPRESVTAGYRKAATLVAERFEELGYSVRRQRFALPAGRSDGTQVPAGSTSNVVAEPPGFRADRPHLVVGAHLDTVPDSPGGNDNASGVAVVMELARLEAAVPSRLPVVFVAFSGEERRRQDEENSVYAAGSKEFVSRMSGARRRAVIGMVNIDMVGRGSMRVMGRESSMTRAALDAAAAVDLAVTRDRTFFYSDHLSFDVAGIPSVWLWTGDQSAYHSPADTASIVRRSALRDVGRLAVSLVRRAREGAR